MAVATDGLQTSGIDLGRLFGLGGIAAAGGLLTGEAYQRLGEIGEQARREAGQLAQTQLGQTEFRPYTVTTGTGGSLQATPEGGLAVSMSPQEQALSQQLFGQAGQMFGQPVAGQAQLAQAGLGALGAGQQLMGQPTFGVMPTQEAAQQAFGLGGQFMGAAGMPTMDREQALFERMRTVQRPEEERQRLALEERLAAQGRLGTSSAAYGGATPEQLAMATAQEEARNRAMLGAMEQARAEQAQQAALGAQYAGLGTTLSGQQRALDAARQQQAIQALSAGQGLLGGGLGLQQLQQQIGTGALGAAYLPQAQALNVLQAGLPGAEMAQRGQLQGANLFGQAEMGGLQALLGSGLGQAELFGQLGTGLLSGLVAPTPSGGSSIIDTLGDIFG